VGDNISNSNTVGYKASRAEFSDLLAEGGDGQQSSTDSGSGNGVQISNVRTIHQAGSVDFTGRNLDTSIAGEGFFVVGSEEAPQYTRAGTLSFDGTGNLVTPDGSPVLGFAPNSNALSPMSLSNLDVDGTPTSAVSISANLNALEGVIDAVPANPATFNEVAADAAFQTSLTVYDSLGADHSINVAYYKTGVNTFTAQAYVNGEDVGGEAGVPVQIGANAVLTFGEDGQIAEAGLAAAAINGAPAWSNGAAAGAFNIDLSQTSQLANNSAINSINQDGQGIGNVTSYEFASDGGFFAVLEGGNRAQIGTLGIANFVNKEGLTRVGGSLFEATTASGEPTIGVAGAEGRGTIQGGALERSTVDLAREFTDLVVYQRGYQGSSQSLTAANDLLRDTLNIIR
jgi:flagellar hook protein FlgE